MNGKPGTWDTIETQLFLSVKSLLIVAVSAAIPAVIPAVSGWFAGQGGYLAVIGAVLSAGIRAIYLRQADNRGK